MNHYAFDQLRIFGNAIYYEKYIVPSITFESKYVAIFI